MHVDQNRWDGTHWEKEHSLGNKADLLLYFSSRDMMASAAHFHELRRQYPQSIIVGCSTGGEILAQSVDDGTLVATAIEFEDTQIRLGTVSVDTIAVDNAKVSHDVGCQLGLQLKSSEKNAPLASVLILSDGTQVNGSELVRGVTSVLGQDIPITGGLAGDGARFQDTYVCANNIPQKGIVAAIGFYGQSLRIGHGSVGGWDAFGPERTITRSKDNVLYELDGQPALALYKKYLGDEADNLPGSALLFPLSIRPADNKNISLVRTILSVDETDQSMTFAGDVNEGYIAQLMRGEMDRLVGGAETAAQNSLIQGGEGDQLAILVSCIGRKLLMGQHTEDEVEAVGAVLGDHTKLIGFYSYGEISPHAASGCCELHNQTMTITTFSEDRKCA